MTFFRLLVVIVGSLLSYQIVYSHTYRVDFSVIGFFTALLLTLYVFYLVSQLKKIPLRTILGGLIGLLVGLFIANLLFHGVLFNLFDDPKVNFIFYIFIYSLFAYAAIEVGLRKGDEFDLLQSLAIKGAKGADKLVDTSVIIDGRIADLTETGFLEGTLLVPQFILQELQFIADSADALKRTRGRRGLDILKRMQNQAFVQIRIIDDDIPRIKEVDAKLVALARKLSAKIVTNDFNLNKVADLQGVAVLNINQLAEALKPVILPGESLTVTIMKEGKEPQQGVGYLDDGTMVVVDHAKQMLGETIGVEVTSVLQTTAGRMIFARQA
ncbi:MAG: TRAM domain-containing protein [Deltaproteobacteria bacterium]|nr:TRAM domain-containing protein [Candidatus Anaeroferrophillacea bacterium]